MFDVFWQRAYMIGPISGLDINIIHGFWWWSENWAHYSSHSPRIISDYHNVFLSKGLPKRVYRKCLYLKLRFRNLGLSKTLRASYSKYALFYCRMMTFTLFIFKDRVKSLLRRCNQGWNHSGRGGSQPFLLQGIGVVEVHANKQHMFRTW